jgi:toxin ParE1/3/4
MRLEFSDFVEGDLDEIAAYIAEDSPRRAVSFIREIRGKFNDIRRNPLLYQLRPDIGETARLASHGRYSILFRVVDEVVRIERVVYGGRDLPTVIDMQ